MWEIPYPDPSSDPDEMLMLVEHLMFSSQAALMTDDEHCPPSFGATGEGISPEAFRGDCD